MLITRKYMPELCVSPDVTRSNLNNVEFDGQCLVATDGHVLVKVPCSREEGDTVGPVSPAALKAARKLGNRKGAVTVVKANGVLGMSDGSTLPRPEAVSFPTWQRVVPTGPGTFTITVNAELLAKVQKALGANAVTLTFTDAESPIRVKDADEPDEPAGEAFALVMPYYSKRNR